MKLMKRIAAFSVALVFTLCIFPFSSLKATAENSIPLCTTADEWTAIFDRRGQSSTWLGADGIYSVALDGNDAYGSSTEDTDTFFIFSDTLMGTADVNGNVTWNAGMPSQTSAILTGNVADSDNISFKWGNGNNHQFNGSHLFGEHKWMLDCFVLNNKVYIFGFPQQDWKPKQIDMISIPIRNGQVNYANYSETEKITQLNKWSSDRNYLYSYGIAVTLNTVSAGAPDPDGYIYIYGYRDAVNEFSRKDLIVSRIRESDFPDFTKITYWDGENWVNDIERSAPLLQNVSCEMSVTPITVGPSAGKYIAIYTEGTEGANINYALGDSPVGPFEDPVTFYVTPEHGQAGEVYTYNAKAHPHLSNDGRLLVSYNCNLHNGTQTSTIYHPRFLWLNLNAISTEQPERNENLARGGIVTVDSVNATYGGDAENLIDGDMHTRWQSNSTGSNASAPAWLQVELEKISTLEIIDLYWEAARPSQSGIKVEISNDGISWNSPDIAISQRTEFSLPKPDGNGNNDFYMDTLTLTGKPTAKYIRITITQMDAGKECPSCWEIEIYGTAKNDEQDTSSPDSVSYAVAQHSKMANSQNRYNIRFIAAVDSLDYANIGFSVTATDSTHIGSHTRLLADNQVFNAVNNIRSEAFGMDGGYVFALALNNVPDNTSFAVRPFAVKEDGTKVYGKMMMIRIINGSLTVQ